VTGGHRFGKKPAYTADFFRTSSGRGYQEAEPGTPLNGPANFEVTQPP
jgi:hypothetical protein